MLKTVAATGLAAPALIDPAPAPAMAGQAGWVVGQLTGAQALTEALLAEGTQVVFGIPGAQENELWDTFKSKGLCHLLVTHEFSASTMADGYARATGCPGVCCLVPGCGVTNALTGIGEALLDSIPMVVIVGDVARGCKYRPFQVHDLPNVELLQPVTKAVLPVHVVEEIPKLVRHAFHLARCGEPGPVAVVVPYNLLTEIGMFHSPPNPPPAKPFDEVAFGKAICQLADLKCRIGIYAGLGCMDYSGLLTQVAELLQAPVATSVCGKGAISDCHPLSVGWGYGPQGTMTAERVFQEQVDLVLAIGVKFSEVSTGFYSIPKHRVIHVDANKSNLGKVVHAEVCVHADAGCFLEHLLEQADCVRRPPNPHLLKCIQTYRNDDCQEHCKVYAQCGADPMIFLLTMRRLLNPDSLVYVDVSITEHWAAEAFTVMKPRTYFNPTDNQAMGWSIPAAIGGQRACPERTTVTITGDGCFLMSGLEMSTAAREGLPVKFFILDDQAYYYMQRLQKMAYLRTTATHLARLDYAALAQGLGLGYNEISTTDDLEAGIQRALSMPGPVLTRVITDYWHHQRPMRWINATRRRYTQEMGPQQQLRFAARLGARALTGHQPND